MSSVAELPSRSPFSAARDTSGKHRHLPVLPSTMSPSNPPHSDPMDITPTTTAATAPPAQTSAEGGSSGAQNNNTNPNTNASVNSNTNANASANSNGSSETPSANSSSTTTTGPNQTIEIPQQGITRSLNVHVSGAIAIYEYSKQMQWRSI